ncbi:hypothetical protein L9F63_003127, partial [Diploptera punctata]
NSMMGINIIRQITIYIRPFSEDVASIMSHIFIRIFRIKHNISSVLRVSQIQISKYIILFLFFYIFLYFSPFFTFLMCFFNLMICFPILQFCVKKHRCM